MTTFNTGNAVPSADARDRFDNSQTFDEVINGGLTYYTSRVGNNVLSFKGMADLFSAAQIDRVSAFNDAQAARDAAFNQFLQNSGYETPVDYAPGISITRPTQIVRYLGELYRPKGSALPFVTSTFAADSAKWIANGDNSLRQELAAPNGGLLIQLFPSASSFFDSPRVFTNGARVGTRTGLTWDVTATNTGEFNHPVTGQGLTPIASPNGDMPARAYNVHRANTGPKNFSGITLALNKLSINGAGILELPFSSATEPLLVSGNIALPENVGLKGSAWNKAVISFDTADGGMTWGSGSILEDVDLRGNGIASVGLIERTEYNRASARRVRIQGFTKWGAAFGMVGAANNSLFEDFQVKFCGEVNIAICQTLNCTFMNFNSDLSTPSTLAARGIKVFNLYPSGTSNQQCRNTRFIGGIHERGSSTYQVEIERATQLSFIGTEFNNGSTATCKISKGSVVFVTPHGTLNGTNKFIEVDAGATVKIYAPNFSGTEGRAMAELLIGPLQMDGSLATQTLSRNLRWQDPAVSGVATFTRDVLTGSRIVSASGGGGNRALISEASGVTLAGKPRVYEIKISVSTITSGVVKAYLSLTGSPFRILAGTLSVGLNTFSVSTDQPSLGAVDLLGDAAFDITILTAEVRSY